jgi:cysteine rich repeat protein
MRLRSIACSMGLLAVLATGTGVALAQGQAQTPCEADTKKFCANTPAGGGRIQACLREHEKELSPECRGRLGGLRREAGLFVSACRNDITRFCNDTSPGGGRVLTCLQQHQSELSPECGDAVKRRGK